MGTYWTYCVILVWWRVWYRRRRKFLSPETSTKRNWIYKACNKWWRPCRKKVSWSKSWIKHQLRQLPGASILLKNYTYTKVLVLYIKLSPGSSGERFRQTWFCHLQRSLHTYFAIELSLIKCLNAPSLFQALFKHKFYWFWFGCPVIWVSFILSQGISALNIAVQNHSEVMVELLIQQPNIEIGDSVHYAVRNNNIKLLSQW